MDPLNFLPAFVRTLIKQEALRLNGAVLKAGFTSSEALAALINYYVPFHTEYQTKYSRYKASTSGTPIFSRTVPDFMKVDERLNNSFMSEIVDTKQGYMIGIPVSYSIEDHKLPETAAELDKDLKDTPKKLRLNKMSNLTHRFIKQNNIHDINMETIKLSSICGTASRLLFVANDEDGFTAKLTSVNPWETIFIYNYNDEPELAIRYYKEYVEVGAGLVERTKVQIYDSHRIYYCVEDLSVLGNMMEAAAVVQALKVSAIYNEDSSVKLNPRLHLFTKVPLFEFVNNNERQGDCDKVMALIDAYDIALSDLASELEQFRLAYIALYGLKADKTDLDKLRQAGMFEMTKDGKVEFITKDVKIDQIIKYLDKLENNIVRFTKSVNFKDENFYGNLSGVAIRYKLMQLEEKSMTTQVKFESADYYMWKTLTPFFTILHADFDPTLMHLRFTRNIPVNMLEEARIQTELEGKVTTRTRLSVASFIADPAGEEQRLLIEKRMHVKDGLSFAPNNSNAARLVDIEAGGPTERNTNGTVEDK